MKKILIIDDEVAYVGLLQDSLGEKYIVSTANNGQAGLALAVKERPDIILLDINMPIMTGMVMLKELRKDEFGKNAKVIFLTNLEPSKEIVLQSIADKPLFFVVKSETSLNELLQKIEDAINE